MDEREIKALVRKCLKEADLLDDLGNDGDGDPIRELCRHVEQSVIVPVPPEKAVVPVHVIFDGPPSHESGRFVEVETSEGKSIRLGQWINRGDGYWALVFNVPIDQTEGYEAATGGV